ncbi:hypothetical protein BGZ95_011400, partial [Linnemannia exigua]
MGMALTHSINTCIKLLCSSRYVQPPTQAIGPQILDCESANSTARTRKRKLREFLEIPKSKSKDVNPMPSNQLPRPLFNVSQVSNDPSGGNQF